MPSWFDFALQTFINQLKNLPSENGNFTEFIQKEMESLMRVFIEENLSTCSDIKWHEQLGRFIIADEQFSDITRTSSEYQIRKYVATLVKKFVTSINNTRKIKITDRARFALQMEMLGLDIGHWKFSRWLPDGNMVAMAALCVTIVAICNKAV